ncbi:hypothetical protein BV22DRAFT_1005127 [Leucogyrophana mollusca]|uniref:Uncharacterized protein n=1 Tax=Leucogyrophana mollusca TaxID=85980 RepID=A0ACB8BU15_9AGAM|nr:hypothetical protein BV22DRAFT_1005127 [Leucogyrophana mollusca]
MFGAFGTQNQTGGSLFGGTNTQQQAQNTGTGIFGNAAQNATQPQTSTSLFGNTTQPAQGGGTSAFGQTGGSLFGSSTAGQGGGSLFGNTNTQQQQPTTGSLFGNTSNQQQPATTGLFGSTNTQQQPGGGSLFGNTNQQQQQPPGGSLFGNTNNQQQPAGGSTFGNTNQPQQQTGGLFGSSTAQQQPSGSLFGNTTAQQQQPATGGLFGNAAQQSGTGGSLFGSTTQAPTSGSLFGNTNNQAPAAGGLFGNTSTASSNPLFGSKSPSSIFGGQTAPGTSTTTNNAPSIFGQSTSTQPAPSLFGQSQQAKPAGSLFGSTTGGTTGSLFGSTLGAPSSNSLLASRSGSSATPQQQADPQSQFQALTQRIEGIALAWDSRSPQCRFQHYFYNLVEPTQVSAFGRPPNAFNEGLWQRAVRENPDPSCLVPVLALGFDDLRERVDAQSKQATAQQEKLKELKKRLESLSAVHQDSNSSRLQRAASLQSQISHRLLNLIQHLHLLIPSVRSSSIRPEEEALRTALEEIEEDIRRPGGMSKMRGKLNELWALVGAVNAARERGRKAGVDGPAEWAVVDEEGLKQIAQILADQQAGLQHLTKVLQRNLKDLAVVQGKSTEEEDSETLYSSTSTLRASSFR